MTSFLSLYSKGRAKREPIVEETLALVWYLTIGHYRPLLSSLNMLKFFSIVADSFVSFGTPLDSSR